MSDRAKEPRKKITDKERDAPTPEAEITPGETAKPTNAVEAKDAFGAPRRDTGWSREALVAKTTKPSFDGPQDKVHREAAKDLKE